MPMEMGRNYLKLPSFFGKKEKKEKKEEEEKNLVDKVDNIGKKARNSMTAKQYVGASCCPDTAAYPCAACCTLNPLQCLATCCCPT